MTTERQEPVETEGAQAGSPGGTTQVGSVLNGIERLTRRLPGSKARRPRINRPGRSVPPREHMAALVEALGDTAHPLHASAVEDLAAIGSPAVPAICEALSPSRPWLTAYRAAEVAGRIGDPRATGPLIHALSHPNSNVRWSAVRALTQVGDMRALLELRRVAHGDQGRTSWGEPVAGAAQSALAEIGRRSVWGQSLELIKTALTSVLMILALILAFSVVSALRSELSLFGQLIPGQTELPQLTLPTAATTAEASAATSQEDSAVSDSAASVTRPTVEPVLAPTTGIGDAGTITGTVRQDANVRPFPATNNQPIGRLAAGDTIIFLAQSPDGLWFLVRLGEPRAAGSSITSADETGWINQALVSPPPEELPVQEPEAPTGAEAAPLPTPSP